MSFPLAFRVTNGSIRRVEVESSSTMAEVAGLMCSLDRTLPRGRLALFHQGVRLPPDSCVREYNLKPNPNPNAPDQPPPAVLTVIVLLGDALSSSEDCTYDEFIDVTFPNHGEKEIPLNIQPLIKFKKNSSGQMIWLPSLVDINALSTPTDGNMREYLGEEVSTALGFVKWTETSYPQRMFLLEINNESVVHDLKSIKYSSFSTNLGYSNGDRHSWQRYTSVPPLDAYVHINEHDHTARLLPTDALKPATVYAVVLLNGVPTVSSDYSSMSQPLLSYWRPGLCEDYICIFRTKKPRVFKVPEKGPEVGGKLDAETVAATAAPAADGEGGQEEGVDLTHDDVNNADNNTGGTEDSNNDTSASARSITPNL
jgi:hypothetical protein